jgi:Uma2 family endonuclease
MPRIKDNATYQDVLNAPDTVRAELIEGTLYFQSPARGIHQEVIQHLLRQLPSKFDIPKPRWKILNGVGIDIPHENTYVVPDISGWRIERFTESLDNARFTVIPDWVCEVLSPSNASYDRINKRKKYLDRGVPYLWLVDTAEKIIEVFQNKHGAWNLIETHANHFKVNILPFEDHVFDLGQLWD